MKTRNRRTKITFPVFKGYSVQIIVARDVAATGRRLGADIADAEAALVTCDEHPNTCWLVLASAPSPGAIAHEASHAVEALLAFAGAGKEEEVFAYHLEYLVGRIHAFLGKR